MNEFLRHPKGMVKKRATHKKRKTGRAGEHSKGVGRIINLDRKEVSKTLSPVEARIVP
jgi:hypothetical protein